MAPCNRDSKLTNSISDHRTRRPGIHSSPTSQFQHHLQSSHFDPSLSSLHDDFFDQILSTLENPIPTSSDLGDLSGETPPIPSSSCENAPHQFDEAAKVAMMMLQHQLLMATTGGNSGFRQFPLDGAGAGVEGSSSFQCPNPINDGSLPSLYNEFAGSLHGSGPAHNPNQSQHFHHSQGNSSQIQNFGVPNIVNNPPPCTIPAQPRQRVRARRGQATDPHSIAERLRRERIAERMKGLQELVPNANKTDKASMLDEIIDYLKFLQLQVKVLSMSRLGGAAAAVPPLVPDISSQGGTRDGGGDRVQSNNDQTLSGSDTMLVAENQVIKLMEEDMGSAMQYLQGKGLCLMPISLASAISTATCRSRIPSHPIIPSNGGGEGPASPSMSVLTVQSATATLGNGAVDRGSASVSKP